MGRSRNTQLTAKSLYAFAAPSCLHIVGTKTDEQPRWNAPGGGTAT